MFTDLLSIPNITLSCVRKRVINLITFLKPLMVVDFCACFLIFFFSLLNYGLDNCKHANSSCNQRVETFGDNEPAEMFWDI